MNLKYEKSVVAKNMIRKIMENKGKQEVNNKKKKKINKLKYEASLLKRYEKYDPPSI